VAAKLSGTEQVHQPIAKMAHLAQFTRLRSDQAATHVRVMVAAARRRLRHPHLVEMKERSALPVALH
jgi:hypothetical protein